ncbi:IS1182 family transposase [Tenacibaculum finnmarkense genomovar ulcerans]|uniref:IS1182 family transposase n=1 Tax=Tenacibaculum finnmarkense TaxID=2781243 RepID=UPI001E28B0D3|nr:IS1182 family transposase [Tenacibaculum finnmarkense]MCD8455189.1 IS1182 family transposase [Tenacibaculum finnmarkense genomovar ulcerans]
MQGKNIYQEKLFHNFQLSDRVPKNNFYRRLGASLDLSFLYDLTKKYYGSSGQKSIDPVVFFKLCLVGYLENIISDRKLITHCNMRMDILFFLGYDIDADLPWHSTISRTRQLFPETVFEEAFTHVLKMCIDKSMVGGHTQTIDSAPVKANASMDTLELKVPEEDLLSHLNKVRAISQGDKEVFRQSKENKAPLKQQTITANNQELQALKSRNKKWSTEQNNRPGSKNKGARYTSNKTHYSPTDPDARISVKPGKARKLNYMSQLSVDISHHVITDIQAYHACKRDNQYLQDITNRLQSRLWKEGLIWRNCVADTGYSSGENYAFLEAKGLRSYIPPHGTYKGGPTGFIYDKDYDHYVCPQGKIIPFKKVFLDYRTKTKKKGYRGSSKLCIDCPIKGSCLGKTAKEKTFSVTYYREEYERNIARIKSKKGRYMKGKRQSTVEPVFGTLTQFMGLRKINTIGIVQANKVMHLSAMAYNLKKYLKFITKKVKINVGILVFYLNLKKLSLMFK